MTPEEKKAYNRAYYEKRKAEIITQHREYRNTEHGKQIRKSEKQRYRDKNLDAVRAAGRLYYELHKDVYQRYRTENADKVRLCAKQSRLNHLAARVATEKSYRQRVKHHRAKTMRQWVEKNRDKVQAWRKANRDRLRVIGMKKYNKRRAALVNAQLGTDREAYTAFAMFLKTAAAVSCYWCGRTTTKNKRHIDHIIALNAGGKDDVYNLCCSCPKCNCAKRDKLPEQFTSQYVLQFS